jgi:hypothetical protein
MQYKNEKYVFDIMCKLEWQRRYAYGIEELYDISECYNILYEDEKEIRINLKYLKTLIQDKQWSRLKRSKFAQFNKMYDKCLLWFREEMRGRGIDISNKQEYQRWYNKNKLVK